MKFSLIIGTLNRPDALENCLKSIDAQTYSEYEVVIIDQSDDNRTENLIKQIGNSKIRYLHVAFKGLSRARNEALKIATGDYCCLIDDDAYYCQNYLEVASNLVDEKVILSGYIFDNITNSQFSDYKNSYNHKELPLRMVLRTCPSAGLVFPMGMIDEVGSFDEKMGLGADYPACEETDLILRAMKKGYHVFYIEELKLKHPYPIPEIKESDNSKIPYYYRGIGAMYRKHFKQNTIPGLKLCFVEVWGKLLIKRLVYNKARSNEIKKMIEELKKGYDEYCEI